MIRRLALLMVLLIGVAPAGAQQTVLPTQSPTAAQTLVETPLPAASTATLAVTETSAPSFTQATAIPDPAATSSLLNIEVVYDVLFPEGVAFAVSFDAPPSTIETVTLAAAQEGWSGTTNAVRIQNAETDDSGRITLSYVWMVPDNPPQLFAPLDFSWRVQTRDGLSETVEVTAALQDDRFSWAVGEAESAPVIYAVQNNRVPLNVLDMQVTAIVELMRDARREVEPLRAVLHDSNQPMDPCADAETLVGSNTGIELPCDPDAAAALYEQMGWVLLDALLLSVGAGSDALTDALIRRVYRSIFESDEVPEWFKTGVVLYFSNTSKLPELEIVRSAARVNGLLSTLETVPTDANSLALWRAQSYGLVAYMKFQLGHAPYLNLLDRVANGEVLVDVWQDQSGLPLSALDVAWRNWLYTPEAEIAYSLPLYVPATLTPLPTRTASLTPTDTPTLTPSRTPTITPTATSTRVGDFVPPTAARTPLPSITPTATLTPRPAQPFSVATSRPVEEPRGSTQNLAEVLVTLGLVPVIGILILVAFFIIRRRNRG